MVALGEFFVVSREKSEEDLLYGVWSSSWNIQQYVPERDTFLTILEEVLDEDNRISFSDALIVASALTDCECSGLVTLDRAILTSRGLKNLASKYGKRIVGPDHLGCEAEV